jgi:hypothetical protein
MALPEHGFQIDSPLTPEDVTPEVMEMFGRYVQQSEKTMLRDVLRERPMRIETPFSTSAGEEQDIFWSAFR